MRRLNGDYQTLFLWGSSTAIIFVPRVPNWQVFEVFIGHIGVFCVLWVREYLFLLLFKLRDKTIKLIFNFA